jgi:hypothetical protein
VTRVLFVLCVALLGTSDGFAQVAQPSLEQRFEGPRAGDTLCAFLLDARKRAEAEGRLDFRARVDSIDTDAVPGLLASISTGRSYAVRRIHFTGHRNINDGTIRRALTIVERDMLDVQRLRRGLTRLNNLGVFQPLILEDVVITRLDDGATVDLTIALRERKRRWWSLSGVPLPGANPLQASLGSRLPAWGRGFFEMATYFVSLNAVGLSRPFLALGRPLIPGQEWLSGFVFSSSLSPRAMATHYGRTHALHALSGMIEYGRDNSLSVDIQSAEGSEQPPLVCKPPKPRLWWLRAAALQVLQITSF